MIKTTKKFGIIGCGAVALDHASVIKKLGHKIILGNTSNKNSKKWKTFRKQNPNIKFKEHINDILNSKKVDYIISCMPVNMHKKYCKKLLTTKKPVLIEKPLHDDFFQLKKILSNISHTLLKNKFIGYNRRFYKTVGVLKKRIQKGGVKSVEITISENYKHISKKYITNKLKSILNVGSSSHILDLAIYFFGPISILKRWTYKKKFNSYSFLLSTKKKNIPIFVNINPHDPSSIGFKIRFDDETLWVLSPIEKLAVYKGYDIVYLNSHKFNKKYLPKVISETVEEEKFRPGFYHQMNSFINQDIKIVSRANDFLNLIGIINKLEN